MPQSDSHDLKPWLVAAIISLVIAALVRALRGRPIEPFNDTPHSAAVAPVAEPPLVESPWVDPVEGECPSSHVVKAKLRSGIFHIPGGLSYERTVPDRCYRDATAAEADGLRAAKR